MADDSPPQRLTLAHTLSQWGYEVELAESGLEALEICRAAPPDLILSDWMMPGMDGVAFCRAFRDQFDAHFAYFILLSARGDDAAIAHGLEAGADDFLTKPVSPEELRARLTAADRLVTKQRDLAAKNRQISETLEKLQTAYASIERDLGHARRIQDSLVPERMRDFGGARVSLLLAASGHVGGDLVGSFEAAPGQIGFYGIDVSGHGIAASMVAARVAGYLNDRYPEQNIAFARRADCGYALDPPETVARRLNDRLSADPGIEEYLTMSYARVDLRRGVLELVLAGHPRPLLLRASGEMQFLGEGGLPIGLVETVQHDRLTVPLHPGDRLLLYSDGFIETILSSGRDLGEAGLRDLVADVPAVMEGPAFLDALFEALQLAANAGGRLEDDVSAALLEFGG
ncbi:PP2C family protein-serine/threonine phosphatase [Roseivivax sp.]